MRLKIFLILSGILFIECSLIASVPPERPNILIFIADDAGMDFGCYGNELIKTPNIDQLAAEGLLFENAFLTTAQCSPSRTSILSGQFAHTIGTEDLHYPLNKDTKLVPYYLKQEGYHTGLLMKRHLGPNGVKQFDFVKEGHDSKAPDLFREFLDEGNGQPFFAWVAFHDPHRPYGGPKGAEKVHQPENVIVPPYFVDTEETREEIAQYYDEVHRMDNNIGAILKELQERGLRDNTVVVLLSDNGMPFPRAKATVYDFGIKTPFIIQGNGISKGARYDGMMSVIDLAPSILELAGIDKPGEMYGESITKIFNDQSVEGREYIFTERNWHDTDAHIRAIRSENYKLVVNGYPELLFPLTGDYFKSATWYDLLEGHKNNSLNEFQNTIFQFPRYQVELYDLKNDPHEINNLIDNREYMEIAVDLNNRLKEWGKETKDHPAFRKRRSDMIDRKSAFFFNLGNHADFKNYGYWDE
jgi:N-sulfoglucosamine sulfohydrolase